MAQAVEKVSVVPEQLPAQMTAITPMAMLAQAIERGMSPETIDKMMGLAERWEANQARKAFSEAFAAFKAEAVVVARNKLVTDGPLKGKRHAELFSFVDAATPALSKHGLSASWEITRDEKDWIEVTCVIEHTLGGQKRVAIGGQPDAGPGRNAIQARISTITYLERATFKAATGLAEQGDDTDGRTPAQPSGPVNADQLAELVRLADEVGADKRKFCEYLKVSSLADIPASQFKRACDALNAKRKA